MYVVRLVSLPDGLNSGNITHIPMEFAALHALFKNNVTRRIFGWRLGPNEGLLRSPSERGIKKFIYDDDF